MDIYDILSVNPVDKEKAIQASIEATKNNLIGLTEDLTCKIYSRVLTNYLRKNHILPIRIDTKTLECPYSHIFHLVPINNEESFIIDLTYSQFKNHDFEELIRKGYTRVNDDSFNDYLLITGKSRPCISLKQAITRDNMNDEKTFKK